jgi:hypothetical protein
MSLMINKGSKKFEMKAKCPYDEVMILKTAIEEAIMKGQKSFGCLGDIPESGAISNEELDPIDVDEGSGVVGWIEDV